MGEEVEAAGGENADPTGVALALAGASRAEAYACPRDQFDLSAADKAGLARVSAHG